MMVYFLMGAAILSVYWQREIHRKEWMQYELEQAVQESTQRVEEEIRKEDTMIHNTNEFVAYLMELILERSQEECDMSIQILQADWDRGLLDFRIQEKGLAGNGSEVSVRKRLQLKKDSI